MAAQIFRFTAKPQANRTVGIQLGIFKGAMLHGTHPNLPSYLLFVYELAAPCRFLVEWLAIQK